MGVRAVAVAHQLDRGGEEVVASENLGVFGEEAEDEPRHKMVHVVAALRRAPFRVGAQKLDIELVQPPGRLDVEGAFADLLNRADPGQGQEKAEMLMEVGEVARDRLAGIEVFGL
nr:hypothetical protein [Rhodothalassium salexigens]